MPKNPGKALVNIQVGGEQSIPPEFIAIMGRTEVVQAVDNSVLPESLGDEIVESKVVTDRTNERVRHTVKKKKGIFTLQDINTNQDGMPVQVTRTLYPTGTTPAVPTSTKHVAVRDLGNGWSIQESSVHGRFDENGTFIPGIFVGPKYEVLIPDTVPEEFKVAIPITTTDLSVVGQATVPILGAGDLVKSEEQTDDFTKRTHVATRATIPVPQSLTGKATNDKKQVVTVLKTYKDAGGDALPTATKDVDVQPLGGGRVLQIERSIPVVLALPEYSAVIDDNIPPEFKALVARKTVATTAIGTAVPFDLVAGEFSKRVQQLDAFDIRTSIETRDTIPGATLLDKYFGGPSVGGAHFTGIVQRSKTFDPDTILTPDTSFLQFESKVDSIGAGASVKSTDSLGSYPILFDAITDEEGVLLRRTKKIVDSSTVLPVGNFSQFAIDSERTLQVSEGVDAISRDGTDLLRIFAGTIDIDLPPQLVSITGKVEADALNGAYSEAGSYGLTNVGNGGIDLHGSAKGAGAVTTDLSFDIKQPWTNNVPCTHYLFYALFGSVASITSALTLLNTATGLSVLQWPKFSPKQINISCNSEKVAGEATGNVHAHDSVTTDYNGVVKVKSNVRVVGNGVSQEIELLQKTIRIPPTIHGLINVTVPPILTQSYAVVGTISSGVNSVAMGVTGTATGSFDPTTILGTPGQQTIPTSGLYLYRLFIEPYKYATCKVHMIVINFANIL